MRSRRSKRSKELPEQVNRSDEKLLELHAQSWENSTRSMLDGPVFDGKISLNDTGIKNEKESTTAQPVREGSMGTLVQPEREVAISLGKNYIQSENVDPISLQTSSLESEREDQQQNHNKFRSDAEISRQNNSSLHQYSNGTAESLAAQLYYHILNDTALYFSLNTSSENITRDLNAQYMHYISGTTVQGDGNDLSSVRASSTLQSLENITFFANPYSGGALSLNSLPTPKHQGEVLHDLAVNSSNTNGFNLPFSMSVSPLFSYLTHSIENSTTPFPDLRVKSTDDLKYDGEVANNIMHTIFPNSSEQYSKFHTRKLPETEPILTLIPQKLHTIPRVPQNNSFILTTVSETKNQANSSENGPSFHSESSVKSTTLTVSPPLFWSAEANISTQSSPHNFSVTTNSTDSRTMSGNTTESSHTVFVDDFPQITLVSVPTGNYSATALITPVPPSITSTSISSMKISKPWVINAASVVPQAETRTSSTISSTFPLVETVTSSNISSTLPSAKTSRKISSSVSSVKGVISKPISNTVPPLETVTSNTFSSNLQSVEAVSTNTISNILLSGETVTSNTISKIVPSPEIVNSNTISNMVPSAETVLSNTISNSVSPVETATSSTISSRVSSAEIATSSTIFNTMASVETVTSNIISSSVPPIETITSGKIFSTVPETVSPSTIYNVVPSSETVTSHIVSSAVPSVNYIMPTEDPTQRYEFQAGNISSENKPSQRSEEEIKKSLTSLSDNTTSLTVTHEVNVLTCERNKNTFLFLLFSFNMKKTNNIYYSYKIILKLCQVPSSFDHRQLAHGRTNFISQAKL